MPLIEDPVGKLMEQMVAYYNRRHDVIATNIANASTPGYKAFEVILRERTGGMKQLEPAQTNSRHMNLQASSGPSALRLERSQEPARLDGNNVSLDAELGRMMENRILYEASMALMDRWGNLKPDAREVR